MLSLQVSHHITLLGPNKVRWCDDLSATITRTSGRCTSFKYSWWWALAPETCSDSAEIKPAQCCIKLVFYLTYTMMHGNTKLKYCITYTVVIWPHCIRTQRLRLSQIAGQRCRNAARGSDTRRLHALSGEHTDVARRFTWTVLPPSSTLEPTWRSTVMRTPWSVQVHLSTHRSGPEHVRISRAHRRTVRLGMETPPSANRRFRTRTGTGLANIS